MNALPKRVAVLGASGYAGQELCERIEAHPGLQLAAAMSAREGVVPDEPALPVDRPLEPLDWKRIQGCDAVFLATPHGASAPLAARALESGAKVVDLSADYRFDDVAKYERVYGVEHPHPELVDEAVYGLVEFERDRIAEARLVAAPGCYPTSVILALRPLIEAELIELSGPIVADCKSGASGAGKRPSAALHFGSVQDNFRAYNVGLHRHAPEIETYAGSSEARVVFVPHLLPCFRGILSTIYVQPKPGASLTEARAALERAYRGEAFVKVFERGQPELSRVVRTNQCHLAIADGRAFPGAGDEAVGEAGTWVLTSAIDNLLKGAAGQALQCLNLMLGFEEAEGLR